MRLQQFAVLQISLRVTETRTSWKLSEATQSTLMNTVNELDGLRAQLPEPLTVD